MRPHAARRFVRSRRRVEAVCERAAVDARAERGKQAGKLGLAAGSRSTVYSGIRPIGCAARQRHDPAAGHRSMRCDRERRESPGVRPGFERAVADEQESSARWRASPGLTSISPRPAAPPGRAGSHSAPAWSMAPPSLPARRNAATMPATSAREPGDDRSALAEAAARPASTACLEFGIRHGHREQRECRRRPAVGSVGRSAVAGRYLSYLM